MTNNKYDTNWEKFDVEDILALSANSFLYCKNRNTKNMETKIMQNKIGLEF